MTLAGPGSPLVSVVAGTHAITAPVALADDTTIDTARGTQLSITGGISEATPGTALTKFDRGLLTLGGINSYTGGTTVTGGTLGLNGSLAGPLTVSSGAAFFGAGTASGTFAGQAGSTVVATGNLAMGDNTSFVGFGHAGTLAVGANAVTLNSAAAANLGVLTTVSGGTLAAPNGISLATGSQFVGFGVVNAPVAAAAGSTIQATGSLTLGSSNSFTGFIGDGTVTVANQTVTIESEATAKIGETVSLNGGVLNVPNGFFIDADSMLLGAGTVNGRVVNQGLIAGGNLGDGLTFSGLVTGAGSFTGSVIFAGGLSPGNDSPANLSMENVAFWRVEQPDYEDCRRHAREPVRPVGRLQRCRAQWHAGRESSQRLFARGRREF